MEEKALSLFFGRYESTLDDKSRISLPSRLRKTLSEGDRSVLMLMPGTDGCIAVYTPDTYRQFWLKISEKKDSSPEKVKWLQRILGEKTASIKMDKQGRFVLPSHLLFHAGIESDLLVIGVQDRIEFWNPKTYDNYCEKQGLDFSILSNELGI